MSSIYKIYQDRLVEISGKSRSLYSKNVSNKKQAYNLSKLFFASESESYKFIEFLQSGTRKRFKLLTDIQLDCVIKQRGIDGVQKKKVFEQEINALKALKREIESIEHETGRYELFVGYPFVEGGIGAGVQVKAPLVLYPARLYIDNEIELEIIRDEPVMLNKVLLLAYAKENRINIEDINIEFESAPAALYNLLDAIEECKGDRLKAGKFYKVAYYMDQTFAPASDNLSRVTDFFIQKELLITE